MCASVQGGRGVSAVGGGRPPPWGRLSIRSVATRAVSAIDSLTTLDLLRIQFTGRQVFRLLHWGSSSGRRFLNRRRRFATGRGWEGRYRCIWCGGGGGGCRYGGSRRPSGWLGFAAAGDQSGHANQQEKTDVHEGPLLVATSAKCSERDGPDFTFYSELREQGGNCILLISVSSWILSGRKEGAGCIRSYRPVY